MADSECSFGRSATPQALGLLLGLPKDVFLSFIKLT
jgi:hypothetical protein